MSSDKVIVVGAGGQDGRLLVDHLKLAGQVPVGVVRDGICDVTRLDEVEALCRETQPAQIYYLAAHHHSAEDRPAGDADLFRKSYEIHVAGLVNFLEVMRRFHEDARLFYAASAHVFGQTDGRVIDEDTPFRPVDIYGVTKASGVYMCRYYRKAYKVYAACGYLFNHESHLRPRRFLSRKIVECARAIRNGEQAELALGDLTAVVDWGWAPDYVRAMGLILEVDSPDDYVIATGERHTVAEFAETAFELCGLDWRKYVCEEGSVLKDRKPTFIGDPARLRQCTGWSPSVTFREMVQRLIEGEKCFV